VQKAFGRPADVLINNAGANTVAASLGQLPWDDFTNVFNSHFFGAALMSKYFISSQPTPTDPIGTIVSISSAMGALIMPGFSGYSVAKFASQRLNE